MKNIISASRRTDIPAGYWKWFQECLKNGYVEVPNPMYPEKKTKVDLTPDNIHSIVLWSKDMGNVVRNPGLIDAYNLYFQYTITGYNSVLEPNAPSYHYSIEILQKMMEKYKSEQFNIRFDPIILTSNGEEIFNGKNPIDNRVKMFERLLHDLHELRMDNCRITTSVMSVYGHVETNMENSAAIYKIPSPDEEMEIIKQMALVAKEFERDIFMCANDRFSAICPNIKKGHCIDGDVLEELFGKCSHAKDQAQRKECGCIKSRDIGSYAQKCPFKCAYCYAQK